MEAMLRLPFDPLDPTVFAEDWETLLGAIKPLERGLFGEDGIQLAHGIGIVFSLLSHYQCVPRNFGSREFEGDTISFCSFYR